MIAAYGTFKDEPVPEREIEQIIERSIEQSIQKLAPPRPTAPQKQKRNDPCACGSGVKYKKVLLFVGIKVNKRNHADQFSAALQIARCCGRYSFTRNKQWQIS